MFNKDQRDPGRAPVQFSAAAASTFRTNDGFTLVETLIVMIICVGLVAMMGGLYRSIGISAISLRSGQQEWLFQRQLRDQLLHAFSLRSLHSTAFVAKNDQFSLTCWMSRQDGLTGKPVLANYSYSRNERVLYYREVVLPSWWDNTRSPIDMVHLELDISKAISWKVLTGVEELTFEYLPPDAPDLNQQRWQKEWQQQTLPRLIQVHFTKGGRNYNLVLEIRASDV